MTEGSHSAARATTLIFIGRAPVQSTAPSVSQQQQPHRRRQVGGEAGEVGEALQRAAARAAAAATRAG